MDRLKKIRSAIAYTVFALVVLSGVFIVMAEYMYNHSETFQEMTSIALVMMVALILGVMLFYILFSYFAIKKILQINVVAADIRKSLLEVTQREESISDALQEIVEFAGARSAFILNTYNEEHHYIAPEERAGALDKEELVVFLKKLVLYTSGERKGKGGEVYVDKISLNAALKEEMLDFYQFLSEHHIETIDYAVILNNKSTSYVLGVTNSKKKNITELLKKIAACFSMAIYNRGHLRRMELMALTDTLTGIANRVLFKRDLKKLSQQKDSVICVYVDVNGLHFYNSKYGHLAGDQMLIFIGDRLKQAYEGHSIYRMGGDEFLVVCRGLAMDEVESRLKRAVEEIEEMKYTIAVGIKSCENISLEEAINEAEQLMYGAKARYYQDREMSKMEGLSRKRTVMFDTEVAELKPCLPAMSLQYLGIYTVSTKTDYCVKLMAPAYFTEILDDKRLFSVSFKRYIQDFVAAEYHHTLLQLLDYDILKKQFEDRKVFSVSYGRIDGEQAVLRIYTTETPENDMDTMWVFEKCAGGITEQEEKDFD